MLQVLSPQDASEVLGQTDVGLKCKKCGGSLKLVTASVVGNPTVFMGVQSQEIYCCEVCKFTSLYVRDGNFIPKSAFTVVNDPIKF